MRSPRPPASLSYLRGRILRKPTLSPPYDAQVLRPPSAGEEVGEHAAALAHAGAQLVATENRRHFTSLLRHGIRVLVSVELAAELGL